MLHTFTLYFSNNLKALKVFEYTSGLLHCMYKYVLETDVNPSPRRKQ